MARSGCVYGPSGSFKTTSVKHLSHYIAEKTGKATLLISTDGGGWSPCDPEIRAGMIVPYRCDTASIPLPILRKLSQGYFPANPEESDVSKLNLVPVDWAKFGGIAVEGLTSLSTMLMRYLADKGIRVGEDIVNPFKQNVLVDGKVETEQFGANPRAHYGFVQNNLYGLVTNFNSLPCEYVLFTAHESKTEDDDRSTIYGPAVAGKKATALVPSWVGDCIHAQDFPIERVEMVPDPQDAKKKIEVRTISTTCRYYFRKHPDPSTGIMFPAKPRVTPEKIAELEKLYPGGFFVPTPEGGFDGYLRTVDRLGNEQGDALQGWREKMKEKLGRTAQPPAATVSAETTATGKK